MNKTQREQKERSQIRSRNYGNRKHINNREQPKESINSWWDWSEKNKECTNN